MVFDGEFEHPNVEEGHPRENMSSIRFPDQK